MKRLALSLILVTMSVLASFGRGIMTFNEAQQQAYFLTDKMAYELDLTPSQYDQVYQVNLEYFLCVNGSDPWGFYWNYRNTDLSYILYDWQYGLYARSEYFYRPIQWRRGAWYLCAWDYYKRTHYYYSRPTIWNTWRGGLWTGRVHTTPSPFIGHRPSAHHGGMRHDPYPNGHPGQPGHNNGYQPGHNNGYQPGHNNGYQPGHNNGSINRPNGGVQHGNGGHQSGSNAGAGNRPSGGNSSQGMGGGNSRPNRGGGHIDNNRGGNSRGSAQGGGTRNFGGGRR